MSGTPVLEHGARGAAVAAIQGLLNRNGALVDEDGQFGPGTEAAVREFQAQAALPVTGSVDGATRAALTALPDPCPAIATTAVTFIAAQEVGSRAEYDSHCCRPTYPGGDSGITIGIGYDLRFEAESFVTDWRKLLTAAQLNTLGQCLRMQGSAATVAMLSSIVIPWHGAWLVFTQNTLPKYIMQTRAAFPNFDDLPPLCRGVLVSLVYNRGPSMDAGDDKRKEMGQIRDAMASHHYEAVPGLLRAMKRLWPDVRGLRDRRDAEASLFEQGLDGLMIKPALAA